MCYTQSIGLRRFLWNDLRNGKYIWDYKLEVLESLYKSNFVENRTKRCDIWDFDTGQDSGRGLAGVDVVQCWGYDTDISEELLSLNETYTYIRTGKYISDRFLVQIGLREGDGRINYSSWPMLTMLKYWTKTEKHRREVVE